MLTAGTALGSAVASGLPGVVGGVPIEHVDIRWSFRGRDFHPGGVLLTLGMLLGQPSGQKGDSCVVLAWEPPVLSSCSRAVTLRGASPTHA